MFDITFSWKSFNINLEAVIEYAKSLDSNCVGASADANFRIHFSSEPSEEIKTQLSSYWNNITEESIEATSYKSAQDIANEVELKKASAITKLQALGLTLEEVKAILGI